MQVYFDSAIVIKLYVPEPDSSQAFAWIQGAADAVCMTALHELEIRNALRLKCARGEITDDGLAKALFRLHEDIDAERLRSVGLDWPNVYRQAEVLSGRFTKKTKTRTLDTLHVAAAQVLGVTDFYSLDHRQRELAFCAGLRVRP